ncbi:MAG: hypothetical protein K2H18_07430, partial [Muribaculaceae bacterium]|nr:hypothetical protein [Muribaculaceae bacterium]
SQKDPQGLIKEGKNNFILTFVNKFKQLLNITIMDIRKKYITLSSLILPFIVSFFAHATSLANENETPLKISDFYRIEKITLQNNDAFEFEEFYFGINPDFMKKSGFTSGRKGRFIRKDVIVWGTITDENTTSDLNDTEIYVFLKFATEEAAKAFMKTCDELGWDNEDPDWRGEDDTCDGIAARRDKSTVLISKQGECSD